MRLTLNSFLQMVTRSDPVFSELMRKLFSGPEKYSKNAFDKTEKSDEFELAKLMIEV